MNQLSEVEAANSSSSNNDMPVLNEGIIVTHLLIVRDIAAECCNLRMGTTLRFYDPKTDVWRVTWVGPRRGSLLAFVARQSADEIVMEVDYVQGLPGMNPPDGPPIHRGQWIFDQIKPNSFHWRSVISHDGGKSWQTQSEMFVRRVKDGSSNGQRSGLYRRNHASRPNHGCTTYRAGTAGSFGNEYGYNSTNTELGISQGGAE